jgi:hypothetical protein
MSDIFNKLSDASNSGIADYMQSYMSNIKDIFPLITDSRILKSHIKSKKLSSIESLLRFSLIFNDLSLVTCDGGKELAMSWLQQKWFEDNFGVESASISVSTERMSELGIDPNNASINPAFIFPSGDEADILVNELQPFIERERLLIQPSRSLFLFKENSDGERTWEGIKVNQFSPIEQWEIAEEASSRPIPIQFTNNDHLNQSALFEITIPYLEGVPFSDLAKILDDEGDLVSGLRSSIKEAIGEVTDDTDPNVIARDVIDPKIDILNRKLKSLISSYAFKVGGAALGTVVLAYTSVATSGVSSAIATVCGSGGIGLLGKEYSAYKEQQNKLKEDPFYFLWKCKKTSKAT